MRRTRIQRIKRITTHKVARAAIARKDYKGKRVTVIGFGRSGKACAELLLNMGAKVFVSDSAKCEMKSQKFVLGHESRDNIEFEFGKHTPKILDTDMIIVSPGIPMYLPILLEAKRRNIHVIGELEFASQFIENPIIGVTGTNGKTTTVFLIHEVLKAAGMDTITVGNLGVPLSSVVGKVKPDTIPIVEVSTFQLESINYFRPWIGVLLNINCDHLDRHKSFEEYRNLKLSLFSNQRVDDFAILNFDDNVVRGYSLAKSKVKGISLRSRKLFFSSEGLSSVARGFIHCLLPRTSFGATPTVWVNEDNIFWTNVDDVAQGFSLAQKEKLFSIRDLNLKWRCLLDDYLATIAVAMVLGITKENILKGFHSFRGVPHRLEDIGVIQGVRFINNSMCTNPSSFVKTLCSFNDVSIIPIVGGKQKGADISPIAQALNEKAKYVTLIGESSKNLSKLLKVVRGFSLANSMEEAVKLAFSHASKGDVVLLSPGFASFDWFIDFRDRGEKFKKAVANLR